MGRCKEIIIKVIPAKIANEFVKKHHYSGKVVQGAKYVTGHQLRYIYFLDKRSKAKLTVPIIPFSDIDKVGAGMYKGEKIERQQRHEMKSEAQLLREASRQNNVNSEKFIT